MKSKIQGAIGQLIIALCITRSLQKNGIVQYILPETGVDPLDQSALKYL
jgi:hypothetical protein